MNQPCRPLCLVPARGGSKRFPRKNIALLEGKPLLAWTVQAAQASGIFDAVWVSSEDAEVLQTAQQWGGQPLPRPDEFAGDRVTVVQVCAQAVAQLEGQGWQYDSLYVLLPTSPLRRPETIRLAWETFCASGADSLLSVIPLEFPPQWSLIEGDGWLRPLDPAAYELPRQRLTPTYRHDGGYAIARLEVFRRTGVFLTGRTVGFHPPPDETIDVDYPADLERAAQAVRQRQRGNGR